MGWLKNTSGKKDSMFTLGVIAFALVSFRVFAGFIGSLTVFGKDFTFNEMDAGLAGTYLAATLGAYVARRYTKDVSEKKGKKSGGKSK